MRCCFFLDDENVMELCQLLKNSKYAKTHGIIPLKMVKLMVYEL
jgi:hypothetical protein